MLKNIVSKVKSALLSPLAALLAFIAQTTDQAVNAVQQMTPILMQLITVIILIALPILVFKVLARSVLDIIRG